MRLAPGTRYRTLLNWPIQAAGTDVLRFAVIGLINAGIKVSAPVHDAVLTVCWERELGEHVATVQRIMRAAAKAAIGREIPVDSKVVRHPDRYTDSRGTEMFDTIVQLLVDVEAEQTSPVWGDIGDIGDMKSRDIGRVYKNIYSYSISPDIPDIPDIPGLAWSAPSWPAEVSIGDL